MSPLPPEHVAKWLPQWRQVTEVAQAAAEAPENDSLACSLLSLCDSAADRLHGWPSPFGHKRDQYVGATLLWLGKSYGHQGAASMRHTLAPALAHLALAFKARLELAAAALEPRDDRADAAAFAAVVPLRRRRDIDDMDED